MAAVSRSKRPLEEFEENRSDAKRQHYAETCSSSSVSPSSSSPSNGLATSPVCSLATSGSYEDSDLDDTILEPSYGEKLDSPTGLSPEAEDKLLFNDLEASPSSVVVRLPTQEAERVCLVASFRLAQLPRAPEKTLSSEPLPLAGPPACPSSGACRKYSGNLESGRYLNVSSQNQNGLGSGFNSPTVAGTAPAVSGVMGEEAIQAVRESPRAASRPVATVAEGQSTSEQQERGGLLHETKGPSDSVRSHEEAAQSSSASDSREAQVEVPRTREPKRPKRIYIQEIDLELSKEKYIYAVLNHARRAAHEIDEVNELQELMRKVASQNQEPRFEHPTDLTVRNYAERSDCGIQRFSLQQWVERSSRNVCRFESIPDHFERSTVPC